MHGHPPVPVVIRQRHVGLPDETFGVAQHLAQPLLGRQQHDLRLFPLRQVLRLREKSHSLPRLVPQRRDREQHRQLAAVPADIGPLPLLPPPFASLGDQRLEARRDLPAQLPAQLRGARLHFLGQVKGRQRLPPDDLFGGAPQQAFGPGVKDLDRPVDRRGNDAERRAVQHGALSDHPPLPFRHRGPQGDFRFRQGGKLPGQLDLVRSPHSRLGIDHPKGTDHQALRRAKRNAQVSHDSEIPHSEVVAHPRIAGGIVHHERLPGSHHMLAKRMRERSLPRLPRPSAQPRG